MFDFLFKRAPTQVVSKPVAAPPRAAAAVAPLYDARTAARHRAESLQHDEAASLAFLLQCEFAEARLIAAQAIQSKAAVAQALEAMRNTDRRVARLMQARSEVLRGQEKLAAACAECTAAAQALTLQPRLTPNQVSELDRRWQALSPLPEALQQAFDGPRQKLAARLTAQTTLQRSAIDLLAALQRLSVQADAAAIAPAQERLVQLAAELARLPQAAEAESLPKHLLAQCEAAASEARATLAQHANQQALQQAAQAARAEQLAQWQACAPQTLQVNALRRQWAQSTALAESAKADATAQSADEADLQARFEALLQQVAACQPAPQPAPTTSAPRAEQHSLPSAAIQHFKEALTALEAALADGALQAATDADKRIRSIDPATLRLNAAQSAQLSQHRAELGRLQGWARWGGNVSREELQKAAEALPAQDLALPELGKRINGLRERWKSLDKSAGPAPKELWLGFDAACTAAHAPIAVQLAQQAAQREKNAELVEVLIAQIEQYAEQIGVDNAPDWKAVAQFCQQSGQSFQRLVSADRRNKKRFEAAFSAALARVQQPLVAARQAEIAQRERMIGEAAALNATERGALDHLKQLQERWQVQARAMPLQRDDEQNLWRKFRAACDAAFAQRKALAAEADGERQQNLVAKQSVCLALEAALQEGSGAAPSAQKNHAAQLREAAARWSAIGPVPRAAEATLEARYRAAVGDLTQQAEVARRSERAAQGHAVQRRLALCLQAERAAASGHSAEVAALQASWDTLGADGSGTARLLAQRFADTLACAASGDSVYLEKLQANRARLRQELLRTEIILSIESPVDSARERLQMQVEVLQSALKSIAETPTAQSQLEALCRLPAALESDETARLLRVVQRLQD